MSPACTSSAQWLLRSRISLSSPMTIPFTFIDPGPLHDGELELVLEHTRLCNERMSNAPCHTFTMHHRPDRRRAGYIDARIGEAELLVYYAGHIGYRVDPPFADAVLPRVHAV